MRILYLDDNPDLTEVFASYADQERDRISVTTATSAEEAARRFESSDIDCLITDFVTTTDGEPFVREVRRSRPDLPILLYSGKSQATLDDVRRRFDLDGTVRKGTSDDEFETLLSIGETLANMRRRLPTDETDAENDWNWHLHSEGIDPDEFERRFFDALEEQTGRPFDEFPPLFEAVDSEALAELLRANPDSTRIVVRFPYDRYEIAVANTGILAVRSTVARTEAQ